MGMILLVIGLLMSVIILFFILSLIPDPQRAPDVE